MTAYIEKHFKVSIINYINFEVFLCYSKKERNEVKNGRIYENITK